MWKKLDLIDKIALFFLGSGGLLLILTTLNTIHVNKTSNRIEAQLLRMEKIILENVSTPAKQVDCNREVKREFKKKLKRKIRAKAKKLFTGEN